jgi:hypothetical protein
MKTKLSFAPTPGSRRFSLPGVVYPFDVALPGWVNSALDAAVEIAEQVQAVAACLVGSHARGAGGSESDVDIIMLLDEPELLLASSGSFSRFGEGTVLIRANDFHAVQE